MNKTSTFNIRRLFTTTLFVGLFSFLGFSQTTVTKTYNPGSSVSIDGCGSYCTNLPGVTFSAADFTAGACSITDVNVNIVWAKTDGTCTAPGTGNSFHNETNFRIDGPTNNVILVQPGTYTGTATMSTVSTTFNQGSPVVGGATPVSGTFGPNNGNLNDFNGTNPFGTWTLRAGDTGGGDPLCIVSYSVTVTVAISSTAPDVPTALVATPSSICPGETSTLTWAGALNDATEWHIYTGSCGGTEVGTSLTNSFTTAALAANTTFYIRGEDGPGGCVDESTGLCGSVSVAVNALDDASFNYSSASYCVDDTDPTPTITGVGGGTFSAGAGLSLNGTTGAIDVSASTPGTYTVSYTTTGTCPNASSVSVTINALDDASFNYSAASYCADDTDPIPTITGLGGGSFSSGAGLSLNGSTGAIDVSASIPGTYTITYTTVGTCPNSSSVSVTIVTSTTITPDVASLATLTDECSVTPSSPTATNDCGTVVIGTPNVAFPITAQGTTTVTWTYDDGVNTITQTQDVIIDDVTAPGTGFGVGTIGDPFTTTSSAYISGYPDGNYYFDIAGNLFEATVDNTTDGGGWILILNYVHQGGTNPALDTRTTNLPIQTGAGLGVNESGTGAWGHAGNVLLNTLDPEELKFFAVTSAHGRVINFKTDMASGIAYATSGTGSFSGLENPANYTLLPGHTATLVPSASLNGFYTNEGDLALTNFPFFVGATAHWGILGLGNRWEVDDFPNNFTNSTIHRAWARDNDPATPVALPDFTAECSASPVAPTLNDNCVGAVTGTPSPTLPITTQGTTVVTWSFDDGNGNVSTRDQNVIIDDVTDPVITCPADIEVNNDAGDCAAVVTIPTIVFGDNCSGSDLSWTITTPMTAWSNIGQVGAQGFPVGLSTVDLTVTDASGNTAVCAFTVTVNDTEVPTITCATPAASL